MPELLSFYFDIKFNTFKSLLKAGIGFYWDIKLESEEKAFETGSSLKWWTKLNSYMGLLERAEITKAAFKG